MVRIHVNITPVPHYITGHVFIGVFPLSQPLFFHIDIDVGVLCVQQHWDYR